MENSEIFREFLSRYKNEKIVIATHSKADPDGIASAFALSKVLRKSVICIHEDLNESARDLVQKLDIPITRLNSVDKKKYAGMVLVDTGSYALIPAAKDWRVLCMIDHHRSEGRDVKSEFSIIDSNSPSTAEIIASLVGEVLPEVAYALSVAIISDGARFKSARAGTFETLAKLMEVSGKEYPEMLEIAEPELKAEAKIAVLKAMQRVKLVIVGGYVLAISEVGSNESDAAALISEAADVVFVASWKDKDKETRISARARKHVKIPLNEVMGEVGAALGGAGGGHSKAAGAAVKAHTEEALQKCVDVFIEKTEK